jgi:hypothetical protein
MPWNGFSSAHFWMSHYPEKQSQQTSSKKCRKTYNRNSGSSIREQLLLLASTSRLTRTTSTRVFPWHERFTNTRRRWRRGAAPQHNNHLRLYLNSALLNRDANNKQQQNDVTEMSMTIAYVQKSKEPRGLDTGRSGAVLCSLLACSSGNWRSTDD